MEGKLKCGVVIFQTESYDVVQIIKSRAQEITQVSSDEFGVHKQSDDLYMIRIPCNYDEFQGITQSVLSLPLSEHVLLPEWQLTRDVEWFNVKHYYADKNNESDIRNVALRYAINKYCYIFSKKIDKLDGHATILSIELKPYDNMDSIRNLVAITNFENDRNGILYVFHVPAPVVTEQTNLFEIAIRRAFTEPNKHHDKFVKIYSTDLGVEGFVLIIAREPRIWGDRSHPGEKLMEVIS